MAVLIKYRFPDSSGCLIHVQSFIIQIYHGECSVQIRNVLERVLERIFQGTSHMLAGEGGMKYVVNSPEVFKSSSQCFVLVF